jgi:TrmH family RNA methyltransferase
MAGGSEAIVPAGPAPLAPAVVLVRPQEEGNVGAVARAMANYGLERLILVEPAPALGDVARAFAVHAGGILERAERRADLGSALAGFGRVVATTAARDRQWPERLLAPRELAGRLAADPPGTSTAIVFGPEASGLSSGELAPASLLVRIPAAARQPTLNLAQAVLVVAYELWLGRGAPGAAGAPADEPRATGGELAGLYEHLGELLRAARFARDSSFPGVERDLRRLLARAEPTRREVAVLRGVLRRLGHALRAKVGS